MTSLGRYPHYLAFAAALGLTMPLALRFTAPGPALLLAFDAAALVFLALLWPRFRAADASVLERRAAEPGHGALATLALLVVAVILAALASELVGGAQRHPGTLGLAATTLTLAWLFANALFALHYTRLYYAPAANGKVRGGLTFPGSHDPDFSDFLYYALTVGMTFQVSDVVITNRVFRRLTLAHAVLAFVFNIAVLALSINVMAGALAG
jgi:uncharacterized membrane protein